MTTSSIFNALLLTSLAGTLSACSANESENGQGKELANEAEVAAVSVTAPLNNVDGTALGQAVISEQNGMLTLTVSAEGLTPGQHGVHIHQTGQCAAPDFKSAGGHWNPRDTGHGLENPEGPHGGDLPNMTVAEDGTGELTHDLGEGSILEGDFALMDADGAAMIVHAGEDDQKNDPSGNSGGRVACGVFAIADAAAS